MAAMPSTSTATEHAEKFATWQPPEPGTVRGKHRDISEILTCCTDDMGWEFFQDVAQRNPGITLADFQWRSFLQQVWESALQEGMCSCGAATEHADWHNEMDVVTWQRILFACKLDTVDGLRKYVQAWSEEDHLVFQWMQGTLKCEKPTADIGGWLADYCNTAFLVLSKQARPNILYRVVSNALYKSLATVIGPFEKSAESSGDVWEQLCWHAYERDRGAFVLSVIWNTTNRCLDVSAADANSSQSSPQREQPLEPPGAATELTAAIGVATEHTTGAAHSAVSTSLTMSEALNLRKRKRPSGLHQAMRDHLQAVSDANEAIPYRRHVEVLPELPWRQYIAFHDKCELFVGKGIVRFYLQFMSKVDPNRNGQLRLNYVVERRDGSVVLLHPGTTPRNDAKPIYLTAEKFQLQLVSP